MKDTSGPQRAIELALAAEKRSLETYLRLAWETPETAGKNMYLRLAMDEFEHMRLLERQHDRLCSDGTCVPVDIEPSLVERVVPRLERGEGGKNPGSDSGRSAALLDALEAENRARGFYREQAEDSPPGPARDMFARLAEMEQAHADLLQAELDNLAGTGMWLGIREFTLEAER